MNNKYVSLDVACFDCIAFVLITNWPLWACSLFCLFELSDMLIITVTTCISRSLFCLMYYWVALQNILGERKSYTLCLDFLCYNLCHTNWHGEKKPSFTGLLRYLFCSCSHVQTSQLWVPAFCFLFLPPVMQHSFCTMWLISFDPSLIFRHTRCD